MLSSFLAVGTFSLPGAWRGKMPKSYLWFQPGSMGPAQAAMVSLPWTAQPWRVQPLRGTYPVHACLPYHRYQEPQLLPCVHSALVPDWPCVCWYLSCPWQRAQRTSPRKKAAGHSGEAEEVTPLPLPVGTVARGTNRRDEASPPPNTAEPGTQKEER